MEGNKDLLISYIKKRLIDEPTLMKENIYDNNQKFKYRNAFLNLKKYIDDFLDGYVENRFIIMPGLRGLGKSTLIFQLYDYLLNQKKIENDRILYLSVDQLNEFLGERLIDTIYVYINEIHQRSPITLDKELFIFIDEAQYDEKWSMAGKIIYDESKKIFMIFTGSSALDFEVNIDSVRRMKREAIYPMNFKEYLYLKHDINLPKGISSAIREMIFTGNIDDAINKEIKIINNFSNLKAPLNKEFENYLTYGSFPMSLSLNEFDIHRKTYDMIERIIEKDVSHYKSLGKNTKTTILKIIRFLSIQKPGELSKVKLGKNIGVSPSIIQEILYILEKTHLIFHIDAYGGAGKQIRKPWKYYFLSPSIKSSINFTLGKYTPENREFLGNLAENLVASYFFKMQETIKRPLGIFYASEKGGVDFLLTNIYGDVIPVEVGIGEKNKKQVKNAIDKYNSDYGIIISNKTSLIKKEDNIIFIPLTTFSYI
ncbi:MAG: AAA family ATPase [Methanobrevibacter sp.]|jgi:predicted AAA+ superfamily ATPase|nr:AAA family ATPase [Candidatus Methanoflexus mossambicus]